MTLPTLEELYWKKYDCFILIEYIGINLVAGKKVFKNGFTTRFTISKEVYEEIRFENLEEFGKKNKRNI